MIRLVVSWILSRNHIGTKCLYSVGDCSGGITITADELGCWSKGQVQDVMEHEYLAIAAGTGADSYGRCGDLTRDHVRYLTRNAFEENASHAGTVECSGIAHELIDVRQ